MPFRNRADAGRQLARALLHLRDEQPVVLALPRGGVPVAAEVANALDAPLDVILVRKLGVPGHEELGVGALGEGGVRVVNEEVRRHARVTDAQIDAVAREEAVELERRAHVFRGDRPMTAVKDHTAIVVDDGIATGSTARAALRVVRALGARKVVLAAPVAPPDTAAELHADADEVVILEQPPHLYAIGAWYRDFTQTDDAEVVNLLAMSGRR